MPFPSVLQPRYDRKHRPLGLPEFNLIKTLPFCALVCRRVAELAADGPTRNTSIPVGLQEKAGMKRGSHSPPAPLRVAVRDVTLQGWPTRSPLTLLLPTVPLLSSSDPAVAVKVAKKGQKTKRPEDSDSSGRRETFQGNNSKGLAAVGSGFWWEGLAPRLLIAMLAGKSQLSFDLGSDVVWLSF